jgi:hypothetical protein
MASVIYAGTDLIISYAYPISFAGAVFYGVASIVNIDPSTIVANKNISVAINVIIGICGFVSIFYWFNQPVPVLPGLLYDKGQNPKTTL